MATMSATRLTIEEIKPGIGSRVLADKATLLSGEHGPALRELLEQRGVLVFPEIDFSDEEHEAFTATMGTVARERHGRPVHPISLDPTKNDTAELLKGTIFWHFDGFSADRPILASLLASKVLPPSGGDTEFCNTYAAYEALSDEDKQALEGLTAIHTLAATQIDVDPQPTYAKWREWTAHGRKELPLVWKHRSGRKSLVIGNSAHWVVGMDPLESKDLLIRLRDFATQPDFTYRHQWKLGDLIMWDNTGSLHRAQPYDSNSGRLLHRTKLEGEEPIA